MNAQPWNPTGQQFSLANDHVSAIVTEVGATLRDLVVDGVRIVEAFAEGDIPRMSQGAMLVPWPNRVRDGVWNHEGNEQQLDLTEPDRHNAIHGLLKGVAYTVSARDAASVTLSAAIHAQHGYPFSLDTSIQYVVTDDGLEVLHTLTNHGATAAPVGLGSHGYYRIGDIEVNELTITSRAATLIDVDDRLNPVGKSPVPAEKDLRTSPKVRDLNLDDAYDGIELTNGRYEHVLKAPDGRTVTVWGDEQHPFLQVFTTSRLRADAGRSIAIEPMTMPADAFNSGDGLRWLEPGETWTARWGVVYGA